MTAKEGEGRIGGRGSEQNEKRTYGHGQQCDDWGRGGVIRGLNDNGKNTIKVILKRKIKTNYKEKEIVIISI